MTQIGPKCVICKVAMQYAYCTMHFGPIWVNNNKFLVNEVQLCHSCTSLTRNLGSTHTLTFTFNLTLALPLTRTLILIFTLCSEIKAQLTETCYHENLKKPEQLYLHGNKVHIYVNICKQTITQPGLEVVAIETNISYIEADT